MSHRHLCASWINRDTSAIASLPSHSSEACFSRITCSSEACFPRITCRRQACGHPQRDILKLFTNIKGNTSGQLWPVMLMSNHHCAGTWAQVMDVSKGLDFDIQQMAIDSPGFQRREAAMQSRAALLRSSQSASMASSMMSSLNFGASIGSSIAASSQSIAGGTILLLPDWKFKLARGSLQISRLSIPAL